MDIYIARQPIFDRKKTVVFYEILYRAGKDNVYCAVDGDDATCSVISNTFLSMGIERITGNKRAFINFTQNLILNETPHMLSNKLLGVELLENISPTEDILLACRKLKENGYMLILDDFDFRPDYNRLIALADIIKVDFLAVKGSDRRKIVEEYGNARVKFLAEKVETLGDYLQAIEYGYEYFQGFFFSKPKMISSHDIPVNTRLKFELCRISLDENTSIEILEQIIKKDVSISYKLLRLVNSAYFGFQKKISSIKEAILIIGSKEIRKWIFLLILKNKSDGIYDELLNRSVIRARLGELLFAEMGCEELSQKIILLELLSETPHILKRPLNILLDELCLDQDIIDALLGVNNDLGAMHELLCSYQNGLWDKFDIYSKMLNIEKLNISKMYLESVDWIESTLN